jgi:succinate-semialdehyde dehydrogenase/glutarate-semialdehyde dehydrogenase
LYVGGEWRSCAGAPVINPANESIFRMLPHVKRPDLDEALIAADEGFRVWRNTVAKNVSHLVP